MKITAIKYWQVDLLLREGRVTATGPVQKILTSKNLSQTFAAPLRLRRRDGRWALLH